MTVSAVLLRVLLSLALVLNGIGSAVAAVHAHAGPADPSIVQDAADVAPCHGEATVPPADADADGDCCAGARCDCACPAPGATIASIMLLAHHALPVALATHRLDAGHRAPALAHPIRPPIG